MVLFVHKLIHICRSLHFISSSFIHSHPHSFILILIHSFSSSFIHSHPHSSIHSNRTTRRESRMYLKSDNFHGGPHKSEPPFLYPCHIIGTTLQCENSTAQILHGTTYVHISLDAVARCLGSLCLRRACILPAPLGNPSDVINLR